MKASEFRKILDRHNYEYCTWRESDKVKVIVQTVVPNMCKVYIFDKRSTLLKIYTENYSAKDIMDDCAVYNLITGIADNVNYHFGLRKAALNNEEKFNPDSLYIDSKDEEKYKYYTPDTWKNVIKYNEPWPGEAGYKEFLKSKCNMGKCYFKNDEEEE